MSDVVEELREIMISGCPLEVQELLRTDTDTTGFAEHLSRMNQKYIDMYVKPVEEAISKTMNGLYKKIAEYRIPAEYIEIKINNINDNKEENKNG